MKAKEFAQLNDEDLNNKLISLKQDLFNLRFSHSIQQLDNPLKLAECKKDIARVKTVIRQRELGIASAPVVATGRKRR